MKFLIALFLLSPLYAEDLVSKQEMDNLQGRLSELEADHEMEIFKFHSTFINQYDAFDKKDSTTPANDQKLQTYRLKYIFGISATPYQNLSLHSQMGISKYYNLMESQNSAPSNDPRPYPGGTQTSNRYDGKFFVKTAYLDYNLRSFPELVFTIGRLPTLDGPPTELLDARERLGTYARFGYGVEGDGIALTYKFDRFLPDNYDFEIRAIYAPALFLNYKNTGSYYPYYQPTYGGGITGRTRSDTYAFMSDLTVNKLKYLDELNIIAQYTRLLWFHYLNETLDDDRNPYKFKDSGYTNNLSYGFEYYSLATTLKNIFKSGFDAHISYLYLKTHSRGLISIPGVYSAGFVTDKESETNTGHTWLISLRYKIPTNFLNGPYLGFEYVESSKYSQFFDGGTDDQNFFYGTQGHGLHGYLTIPILPTLTLRSGYRYQESDWFKDLGPPQKIDQVVKTVYSNLRLDF